MNDGISFEEACALTPEALTAQQLQACPGQISGVSDYVYIGIPATLLVIALVVFLILKSKRSKKSS